MWITIEIDLDDPLLDFSESSLNRTVDLLDVGERKVPLIQYSPDLIVKFGEYEVIDAEWEAIEDHLINMEGLNGDI